jgi:hypothetical protein
MDLFTTYISLIQSNQPPTSIIFHHTPFLLLPQVFYFSESSAGCNLSDMADGSGRFARLLFSWSESK